jgi:hypothetical protein
MEQAHSLERAPGTFSMTILRNTNEHVPAPTVSADTARDVAADYLVDQIGELMEPGAAVLDGARWVVPVYLSVCPHGRLGQIGAVTVDATTGAVLHSEEERAEMKASARALAAASSR